MGLGAVGASVQELAGGGKAAAPVKIVADHAAAHEAQAPAAAVLRGDKCDTLR